MDDILDDIRELLVEVPNDDVELVLKNSRMEIEELRRQVDHLAEQLYVDLEPEELEGKSDLKKAVEAGAKRSVHDALWICKKRVVKLKNAIEKMEDQVNRVISLIKLHNDRLA